MHVLVVDAVIKPGGVLIGKLQMNRLQPAFFSVVYRNLCHVKHLFGLIAFFKRFLQTVAFPAAVDDMRLVSDAVQQGGGHTGITKYLRPISKAHVGGDHHRLAFMALGQNLKNQLCPFCGEGNITQFINNEQAVAGIPLDDTTQKLFISGFNQLVGQPAAGNKAGAYSLFAGFHAQGGGQMGFAGTALPIKMTLRHFSTY